MGISVGRRVSSAWTALRAPLPPAPPVLPNSLRHLGRGNLAVTVSAAATAGILVLPHGMPRAASLPLLLIAIAGLAAAMLLAARGRHQGDQPDRRVVGRLCAALLFLAVVSPPHRAPDLWRQAMYGRMATVLEANPYIHRPAEHATDPFYERVDAAGQGESTRSGPALTVLSSGIADAAGLSPLATRLAHQALAAMAIGLATILVDRRSRDPVSLALIGCNPLVILYAVNGAPGDALVAVGLLGAVLLAEQRRPVAGGAVLGLTLLVKLVAGLALLPLAAWSWRQHDRKAAALVALPTIGIGLAGYVLAGGEVAMRPLFATSATATWSSLWRPVQEHLSPASTGDLTAKFGVVAVVAVVAVGVVVLRAKLDRPSPTLVCGAVLVVYLAGAPYAAVATLVPALVLLAPHWRERSTGIALAFAAVLLVAAEHLFTDPVVDGIDRLLADASTGLYVVALGVIALLAVDAGMALAPTVGPYVRRGGWRGRGRGLGQGRWRHRPTSPVRWAADQLGRLGRLVRVR